MGGGRKSLPGKFIPRHLCFFPAVHTSYTRFRDYGVVRHKNLSFGPMIGVDEKFESGLTSARCTGKSSRFVAALVKRWIAVLAFMSMWRQLDRCAMECRRCSDAYLSQRDKAGAANRRHVQARQRWALSDVTWISKYLEVRTQTSVFWMYATHIGSLNRGLRALFCPVYFGGHLTNAH